MTSSLSCGCKSARYYVIEQGEALSLAARSVSLIPTRFRQRLKKYKVSYDSHQLLATYPKLRQLLKGCLDVDEEARLTAQEALDSDWLRM